MTVINNGESGLSVRSKLNANFSITEANSQALQTLSPQVDSNTSVITATNYATRTDFLAANVPPVVARTSFFVNGETYAVVRDGSGPIVQTNGQRWRPDGVVTPQHFGAVGDGVADDTSAVQAAVDFGPDVYFPEGTYIIANPGLFVVAGLRLSGAGKTKSILKKKPNIGATDQLDPILRERFVDGLATPAYNITVERLGFEGNGDAAIKTNKAGGLIRFYEHYGFRAVACAFYKSRGYGVGFQGTPSAANADRRGPHVDTYFEDCDFYENGKQDYLLGSDADDGIDFKSSDRALLINCRAWDNGDKGFDLRGRGVSAIGCRSWNNAGVGFSHGLEGVQAGTTSVLPATCVFTNCWAWGNTGNGFVAVPQVTPGVVDALQFTTFNGCVAWDNTHNFAIASQGANDLSALRFLLQGCTSRDPKTGTRHFLGSGPAECVTINGGFFVGGSTAGVSVSGSQLGPFNICGATFENIGGSAITGSANTSARTNITGNTFRNITSAAFAGSSNSTVVGNTYELIGSTTPIAVSGTNNRILDKHQGLRTIASSGTITIPEISDMIGVSGTTDITSITPSWPQRIVTLRFDGVLNVTDGGNLILAGSLTTAVNTVLTLQCDGTNWYEMSRSVN